MYKLLFLLAMVVAPSFACYAQDEEQSIEELQVLVNNTRDDTIKVDRLTQLALKYVYKPGAYDADMTPAINLTNKALLLSHKLHYTRGTGKCYFVYSNICRERNEHSKGIGYIQKATDIFSRLGIPEDVADAYQERSNYINTFTGDLEEKTKLVEQAAALYKQADAKQKEADILKYLGDLYYLQDKSEKGLIVTKRALQLYKEVKYSKLQAVYDQLGVLFTEVGQYNEAIKYGLLALKTAEREKDTSALLCTIYNRLGLTHYYLNQTDKANHYYYIALSLALKNKDTLDMMTIANNISNAYQRAGKPSEAINFLKPLEVTYGHTQAYKEAALYKCLMTSYIYTKQYKLAKPYTEEALQRSRGYTDDDPRHLWTDVFLIEYYVGLGQYSAAIDLCSKMEALSKKLNKTHTLKTIYYNWYLADSATGNDNSALYHYKAFVSMRDSLNSVKVKNETAQLLVEYETEKKEKDIKLLTQQSKLQQSHLQQATFFRNVTLSGVIISIFFIGLLYSRYRLKQRSNRLLEQQQKEINEKNTSLQQLLIEKEWLLKEIHHRIKNNLQTVMSLLNSQSVYLQNDAAVAAIRDSQHRIHAMSLIHQKLYNSDNVSVIDMPAYIQELVTYMRDCFGTEQRVEFIINITPIKLDVSQAIPLGLILNEAITNSLKYAFPNNGQGNIEIKLEHKEQENYLLTIADDGIGIPDNIPQQKGSLGMSLMKGLSEDLDGCLSIENKKGTILKIQFVRDAGIEHTKLSGTLPNMNN